MEQRLQNHKKGLIGLSIFYQNRLCNEYGLMVRDVISTYVEEEISTSVYKWIFTDWTQVLSETGESEKISYFTLIKRL